MYKVMILHNEIVLVAFCKLVDQVKTISMFESILGKNNSFLKKGIQIYGKTFIPARKIILVDIIICMTWEDGLVD